MRSTTKSNNIAKRIASIALIVLIALSAVSCDTVKEFIDGFNQGISDSGGDETPPISQEPNTEPSGEQPQASGKAGLTVCMIDVGQADSIYIECDGEKMLIDGGNVDDSNLVYAFLQNKGASELKYVVGTHAHEDHIGGLAGALNYAKAGTIYCPVTTYNTRAFRNFAEAAALQKKKLTVPKVGLKLKLGSANLEVVGPINNNEDTAPNNTSIVIKLTYGSVSFLFTGDAEKEEEADILNSGKDLSATVLKAPHHGSSTSSTYNFIKAVQPSYVLVSVGTGNTYGHPNKNTISRFSDAGATIFRTDQSGDVYCYSDGKGIWFETKAGRKQTAASTEFVASKKTKLFHIAGCKSMPTGSNAESFKERKDAVNAGYKPCETCQP